MNKGFSFIRLMNRSGRFYIILATAAALLISFMNQPLGLISLDLARVAPPWDQV